MIRAKKLSVEDIRGIGTNGCLTVELPDYMACRSAVALTSYVRKAYKREDGQTYSTKIVENVVTIKAVDKR